MGGAPAVVKVVGGTPADAVAYTEAMYGITLARNPNWTLPALGFAFCIWMMGSLSAVTWVVFGVWMAAGLVFYFLYGHRRSRLATPEG